MVKLSIISLLALASLTSALTCSKYGCSKTNLANDQCISYNGVTNTYDLQECSSNKYCPYGIPAANATCTPTPSTQTAFAWPGEHCSSSSDCYYSAYACVGKICGGLSANSTCTALGQCNPGLYCNFTAGLPSGVCSAQTSIGGVCSSDFQCVNTAFCYNSVCTPYFNIPSGNLPAASSCSGYSSNQCSSGACAVLSTVVTCVPAVSSATSLPTTCADSTSCTSNSFIVNGGTYTLTGDCECGYNNAGTAYCSLHPGDNIYQKYIQYYKKWAASSDVNKCNTFRRNAAYCRQSVWDSDDAELFEYYEAYTSMYPKLQNNDACVKAIYTNSFYQEQDDAEDVDDDDDSALWLASSAVVALALY